MPDGAAMEEIEQAAAANVDYTAAVKSGIQEWAAGFSGEDFGEAFDKEARWYDMKPGETAADTIVRGKRVRVLAADTIVRVKRVRVLHRLPQRNVMDSSITFTCSCSCFQKYGQCKHALALSVEKGDVAMRTKYLDLRVVRRAGRPRKEKAILGGLIRQPGAEVDDDPEEEEGPGLAE